MADSPGPVDLDRREEVRTIGTAIGIIGTAVGVISFVFAWHWNRQAKQNAQALREHQVRLFEAAGLHPGQREALMRGPIDREWLVEIVGEEGADSRMGKWILAESKKPIIHRDELCMMWGLLEIA